MNLDRFAENACEATVDHEDGDVQCRREDGHDGFHAGVALHEDDAARWPDLVTWHDTYVTTYSVPGLMAREVRRVEEIHEGALLDG